ncbi:hypothetical protein PHYBOEH_001167 [Phytophthora boehmeriae]|uniref:Uncharacterized protein n=1 Tax=Phytophthora boehmeriae TaxID=109152 RepID=A0A8T1WZL2_9STRA|nr:hypothetical protein PHYBOEH_001167 [Phytophthora boehmeriae]
MQRRLLIKIYEPMSSVESHMDVDTEDLRQDFGEQALAAFNSGEYRTLCDLMLGQLDRMMGANEQRASPLTPPQPAKKAAQAKKHPKAVKPNGVRSKSTAERDNELNLLQQDSESNHHDVEQPELLQSDEEAPLSTQDQDHGRRAVVSSEASVLKIQCAARQRQARQKVNRVRDEKLQIIAADNAITADIDPPSRPETVMSYMSEQFEDDHDQQNEAR